jgi:hypothetical protein
MVTASQLNRSAVDEPEFDHSHIAGGISKINTADNVFGIFTSRAMRERGRYQIQCMKSRNSTGVGQKIDLEYNIETMRITDPGVDANEAGGGPVKSMNIMSQIKNPTAETKPATKWETPRLKEGIADPLDIGPGGAPKVTGEAQSTKLKQMLAGLKNG